MKRLSNGVVLCNSVDPSVFHGETSLWVHQVIKAGIRLLFEKQQHLLAGRVSTTITVDEDHPFFLRASRLLYRDGRTNVALDSQSYLQINQGEW